MTQEYKLPDLPYAHNALEPYIDEATMKLHHGKHHAAYVNGFNAALKKLEEARAKGDFAAIQALSKALAFHGSGHTMHSIFWQVMCPSSREQGALIRRAFRRNCARLRLSRFFQAAIFRSRESRGGQRLGGASLLAARQAPNRAAGGKPPEAHSAGQPPVACA